MNTRSKTNMNKLPRTPPPEKDEAAGGQDFTLEQLQKERDSYKKITEELKKAVNNLQIELKEKSKQTSAINKQNSDFKKQQESEAIREMENMRRERLEYQQTAMQMKNMVESLQSVQQQLSENSSTQKIEIPQSPQNECDSPNQNDTKKLRITPFYKPNPKAWFSILELAFDQYNITRDDAKFGQVLMNIDPSIIDIVQDLMDDPPATQKYQTLKKRIIDALAESSEAKLRKILQGLYIGDDKPSVYLYKIKSLAGGQCSEPVLESIFSEGMPERIRSVLVAADTQDLNKLAVIADRVWEATPREVHAVSTHENKGNIEIASIQENKSEKIESRLGRIEKDVEEIKKSIKYLRRNNRSRSRSSSTNREQKNICWTHRKFKDQARFCVPPCEYKKPAEN